MHAIDFSKCTSSARTSIADLCRVLRGARSRPRRSRRGCRCAANAPLMPVMAVPRPRRTQHSNSRTPPNIPTDLHLLRTLSLTGHRRSPQEFQGGDPFVGHSDDFPLHDGAAPSIGGFSSLTPRTRSIARSVSYATAKATLAPYSAASPTNRPVLAKQAGNIDRMPPLQRAPGRYLTSHHSHRGFRPGRYRYMPTRPIPRSAPTPAHSPRVLASALKPSSADSRCQNSNEHGGLTPAQVPSRLTTATQQHRALQSIVAEWGLKGRSTWSSLPLGTRLDRTRWLVLP
jgi:hypothetical protein